MIKRRFRVIPNEYIVAARVQGQRMMPVWLSKVRWVVLRGSKTPILAVYRQVAGLVSDENPIKVMILGEDTSVQVVGEKGMVMVSSRVRRNDTWGLAFESGRQRRRMYELIRLWIELGNFLQTLTDFSSIAKSHNSIVYRCRDRDDPQRRYAIKRVDRLKCWNEVEVTERVANIESLAPYVPRYIFMFEDSKDSSVTIVMQHYAGGSLTDRIRECGPLNETVIRSVITALCCALFLLHENQILHLDVKAGNILFDSESSHEFENLKLVDFGSSAFITDDCTMKTSGTYGCMAPERFDGRYGPEADVYGVGVVLYHMVTGEIPFNGDDSFQIMAKNMQGDITFAHSHWHRVSSGLRELAGCMLTKDPDARITIAEVLQHKWLFRPPPKPRMATKSTTGANLRDLDLVNLPPASISSARGA
ncbi:TPA: hypothetical protein N0F65_009399 [Lagenidium giganteum]|uniref:Protein kinase domain-containing protein n=1 Tax=Lagenidium giganteum TaxID=4803 RepID=A0AAV2ZF68_9STRA|nr:TPA: hypothetical protein N0F65_009399 [Lagenidium giganteum]